MSFTKAGVYSIELFPSIQKTIKGFFKANRNVVQRTYNTAPVTPLLGLLTKTYKLPEAQVVAQLRSAWNYQRKRHGYAGGGGAVKGRTNRKRKSQQKHEQQEHQQQQQQQEPDVALQTRLAAAAEVHVVSMEEGGAGPSSAYDHQQAAASSAGTVADHGALTPVQAEHGNAPLLSAAPSRSGAIWAGPNSPAAAAAGAVAAAAADEGAEADSATVNPLYTMSEEEGLVYAMAVDAAREDAEGLNDSYRQFKGKSWPRLWLDTRQEPPRLPEEASMLPDAGAYLTFEEDPATPPGWRSKAF